MKAFQELTEWAVDHPVVNHVYFLNDSRDKMYGYVQASTGIVQAVKKPYRFFTKGRKFKEVENRWNFVVQEEETEDLIIGRKSASGCRSEMSFPCKDSRASGNIPE